MAHFHPLRWEIDMSNYKSTDLPSNPVVQAVFVHEYVHYVQTLTGTIGRHIVLELARLSVLAGIHKVHGPTPPTTLDRIRLKDVLTAAIPADFDGSEPRTQHSEFCTELEFALADRPSTAPPAVSAGSLIRLPLKVGPHSQASFVHVVAKRGSALVAVPITDRVVFENMARQVQRKYLLFNNNLDASIVDGERNQAHADLTYVCLHDALKGRLPTEEDSAKWTIVLCQIALLCRNPGAAFEHMMTCLTRPKMSDIELFISGLKQDAWFKGEFNEPPAQKVVNELAQKWGSMMLFTEQYELREFTKLIANAHNALLNNFSLMAGSLVSWKDVGSWLARFGCPPVIFSDVTCTQICGTTASAPWTWYLRRLDELLTSPDEADLPADLPDSWI